MAKDRYAMNTSIPKKVRPFVMMSLPSLMLFVAYTLLQWFPFYFGIFLVFIISRTVYETSKDKKLPVLKRFVDGDANAKTTIFMIHGWPDNKEIWTQQIDGLSQHRLVRVELPNFGKETVNEWGYSFDELGTMIIKAMEADLKETGSKTLTLLIHDWGAYTGMMIQRRVPNLVERMIVMDVVWCENKQSKGLKVLVRPIVVFMFGIVYMFWNSASFMLNANIPVVGKILGDEMVKFHLSLSGATPKTSFANRPNNLSASIGFPYWYLQMITVKEAVGFSKCFDDRFNSHKTPVSWAENGVPTLYFYGADKLFNFHLPFYPKKVAKQPKGKVVALKKGDEGCKYTVGHWLQQTAGSRVNSEILKWIADTN